MIKVTQAPQGPVQVRQRFSISGVASPNYANQTLTLTVDGQYRTAGPIVAADGSWKVDFLFQQAGSRRLRIAVGTEGVDLTIQVVTQAPQPAPPQPPKPTPQPPRSPRLRFTNLPARIRAEENIVLSGEADDYADGDQLVLRADQKYELARPRVQAGKWQAPVVFRQAGRRLIEIIGSEQDRAQVTLDVQPNDVLKIVPRSAWTSQATPADLPNLQPKRITLHHTFISPTPAVSASQAQELERMRSIWRSHVQGNGWSDIGYHYIIMPSGRIYEARSERRRGAHDVVNDGIGVAFDGVYSSQTISAQQFQSAVTLCTTLCQRYGFKDPATPVPTPTAEFGTRNIPLICGHRDRVSTECPGSPGGRTVRLEEIRQTVKQRLR
ncbi:N-acetylmuramoyl-L-alanine amidase [Leptolyngbya sp. FACHB-36]|uniref:peptidoglycan recognition protein family protein n=1 Tax=Leptolyngbya sp. FACHB-36 TaxID=2692808 RepID=UPI001681B108|nr:peptidoglycan recognition family protein [Leptolyngbya sp. FACHB-36]MBD2020001.1 N-acetylmuramoyl-L-alanine amidase [Leptolyngbya sp. FACHB-36]